MLQRLRQAPHLPVCQMAPLPQARPRPHPARDLLPPRGTPPWADRHRERTCLEPRTCVGRTPHEEATAAGFPRLVRAAPLSPGRALAQTLSGQGTNGPISMCSADLLLRIHWWILHCCTTPPTHHRPNLHCSSPLSQEAAAPDASWEEAALAPMAVPQVYRHLLVPASCPAAPPTAPL